MEFHHRVRISVVGVEYRLPQRGGRVEIIIVYKIILTTIGLIGTVLAVHGLVAHPRQWDTFSAGVPASKLVRLADVRLYRSSTWSTNATESRQSRDYYQYYYPI